MAEKSNCPGGNWKTCPFSGTTGHYINMSNTNTVWIGLGESMTTGSYMGGSAYGYNLMLIENVNGPTP